MEIKNVTIFVKGTIHTSNKGLEELTQDIKFDCFFGEGIQTRGAYNSRNFLKDPFILIAFFIWLNLFCKLFQRDIPTIKEISKREKIPLYYVDKNLDEILKDGYSWYNFIVYLALFIASLFLGLGPSLFITNLLSIYLTNFKLLATIILFLIITFFLFELSCLLFYVLFRVKKTREMEWIKYIKKVIEREKYNKLLLVCGSLHRKTVMKKMKTMGFVVKGV